MVLKHFILPVDHFKTNLFFSNYDPPLTHPITLPRDCRGVDLIKVKKQVDFKVHFRWFQAFLEYVGFFYFSIKGAGWLGPDP